MTHTNGVEQFFKWATEVKGLSMTQIASVLGYTERHTYRIRKGRGSAKNLAGRALMGFGDDVRAFFAPAVLVATQPMTVTDDGS